MRHSMTATKGTSRPRQFFSSRAIRCCIHVVGFFGLATFKQRRVDSQREDVDLIVAGDGFELPEVGGDARGDFCARRRDPKLRAAVLILPLLMMIFYRFIVVKVLLMRCCVRRLKRCCERAIEKVWRIPY